MRGLLYRASRMERDRQAKVESLPALIGTGNDDGMTASAARIAGKAIAPMLSLLSKPNIGERSGLPDATTTTASVDVVAVAEEEGLLLVEAALALARSLCFASLLLSLPSVDSPLLHNQLGSAS